MPFVVIARDKPDPALRLAVRADHLDYIASRQDNIIYSGPLLEDGRMIGSLFVFDLPDRTTLEKALSEDPYFEHDIFASVEILESRWMVPERTPGALKAEAEKARQG